MKFLICWVLLAVVTPSFSQVGSSAGNHIFDQMIIKNLRFPASSQRLGKSVRVYVGFTVTKQGSYSNVSIVNLGFIDESFRQEVNRLWSTMSNQDPKYAGTYVLPIAFLLGEGRPDRLMKISNEADEIAKKDNYKLLKEVSVVGYLACEKKSLTE